METKGQWVSGCVLWQWWQFSNDDDDNDNDNKNNKKFIIVIIIIIIVTKKTYSLKPVYCIFIRTLGALIDLWDFLLDPIS